MGREDADGGLADQPRFDADAGRLAAHPAVAKVTAEMLAALAASGISLA